MAIWEIKVVCSVSGRFWSNVYHIDIGADTDVDSSILSALSSFYTANMLTPFTLERIIRRPADTADAFTEMIIQAAGTRSLSGSFALPLYNTLKMILQSGPGRPGLKYLRGMLLSSDITDSISGLNSSTVSAINSDFDDVLNAASTAGQSFVEGASDSPVVSAEFPLKLQMRQEHRKRRNTA